MTHIFLSACMDAGGIRTVCMGSEQATLRACLVWMSWTLSSSAAHDHKVAIPHSIHYYVLLFVCSRLISTNYLIPTIARTRATLYRNVITSTSLINGYYPPTAVGTLIEQYEFMPKDNQH